MCGNQCGRTPDDCHDEKVISDCEIKRCSIVKDCSIVNLGYFNFFLSDEDYSIVNLL